VNEEQLRHLLRASAEPRLDDEVRAVTALFAGRSRQRRTTAGIVVGVAAAALGVGATISLLPKGSGPATDVVLGCAAGVGTVGRGLVTSGLDGVTLAVDNPTGEVLTVSGGSREVLALPGASQVTLPLASGTTLRCGTGSAVRLTVRHVAATGQCSSVATAGATTVQRGEVSALTRAELGTLPFGAVVDPDGTDGALRHVQVRSAGKVVAEAVWHAMPAVGDWQLESLSRCG
jgi:hypothetical protein